MAVVAHLLEHTVNPGDGEVNDVVAMILAIDDGVDTTTAAVKARGVTVWNAYTGNTYAQLPTGYFDTDRIISSVWGTAGYFSVFGTRYKGAEKVA